MRTIIYIFIFIGWLDGKPKPTRAPWLDGSCLLLFLLFGKGEGPLQTQWTSTSRPSWSKRLEEEKLTPWAFLSRHIWVACLPNITKALHVSKLKLTVGLLAFRSPTIILSRSHEDPNSLRPVGKDTKTAICQRELLQRMLVCGIVCELLIYVVYIYIYI